MDFKKKDTIKIKTTGEDCCSYRLLAIILSLYTGDFFNFWKTLKLVPILYLKFTILRNFGSWLE